MPKDTINFAEIENKWQKRWSEARVFEAEPIEGKEKFFIIFAYPGVSGYLHVGHMRCYAYADILARYMRSRGRNVLFPVGVHPTGNVAISLARRVERGDPATLASLRENGCPEEMIPRLASPSEVVRFFSQVYVEQFWQRFGFSADYRRFTTTIDEGYKRFIQWQFKKLMERGLLIQKPYFGTACIHCGPVAVDPSETDLSEGGGAEKLEFTLIKCRAGEEYLVAATLRPETVFGQTNFWANPEVEYARVRVGSEHWIVSRECAEKLSYQMDDVEVVGSVSGRALVGRRCRPPFIHREVAVLPAKFCDPAIGTGLVTSVPSDAPYDWAGLLEMINDPERCRTYGLNPEEVGRIEPIPIIETPNYGPLPAVEICERLGISSLDDPRLEEATKEIYSAGFHRGVMNERCGEYAGLPVARAKEEIRDAMVRQGDAALFYDLSERVTCRCGGRVVVRRIPDQWFINYGDAELTERSKAHAAEMTIAPEEYHANIQSVLEWFQERACVRQGNWLGTPFPLDERWTIEPISDSTLYPLYYLVSKYVNARELHPEEMDDAFFDAVFLGKGELGGGAERVRKDVLYWYPLDINLGGKEHMTVHFPVFLMNHVAILPKEMLPRGIVVNWYIVMKGGKISKSKGGAVPIPDAAQVHTVDAMRLYYAHSASPFADVEWDEKLVSGYRQRLERIFAQCMELSNFQRGGEERIDRWLETKTAQSMTRVIKAFERFDLRAAAGEVYFTIPEQIRWYMKRGGKGGAVQRSLRLWVQMMAPFTPHIAEELWELIGGDGFVSTALLPTPKDIDEGVLQEEDYILSLLEDIAQIKRVTKIEKGVLHLYVAEDWKRRVREKVLELHRTGTKDHGAILRAVMEMKEARAHGKAAAGFVQKLTRDIAASHLPIAPENEHALLHEARDFLSRETGCRVEVHAADELCHDPKGKAAAAVPGRAAIYLEA
ncbi:MAG: leucine--tRNA ligase [Candidatus Thermoplasmatota archaeon]